MTTPDPWFPQWNYELLDALFRLLPYSASREDWFQFFISNPLVCTWFFAVLFYRFWTIDDEQQRMRRDCLFRIIVALSAAVLVTGAIRPWISWPAPVRNPAFHALFPSYLWGNGSRNCFPSHSTLAYFTVAAGFWPLDRRVSVIMSVFALACVSLPRVYVGGHYPVDILFSCGLGIGALIAVWRCQVPTVVSCWLHRRGSGTATREWLMFLWIFELGEGFRGTEFMIGLLVGLYLRI